MESEDQVPIVTEDGVGNETRHRTVYRSYPQRWWVLLSFTCMSFVQSAAWNAFGPVDVPLRFAYGWSDATVAAMANWGTVTFLLFVAPIAWAASQRWFGLRRSTLLVGALVSSGTVAHAAFASDPPFTPLAHLGSILNGIAGVTVMSAPPAISAAWFPPSQRTTATSVNQMGNVLGASVAAVLGPLMVPDFDIPPPVNGTLSSSSPTKEEVRKQLRMYFLLCYAVPSVLLFAAMIAYFPSKPPSPPSASGAEERVNFKEGLRTILSRRDSLLASLSYAAPSGLGSAWSATLAIFLRGLGVDEREAGLLSLTCTATGVAACLLTARVLDRPAFKRRLRATIVVLFSMAAVAAAWMAVVCDSRITTFSRWQLWTSNVLCSSLSYVAAPLTFEYAAELSYPAQEGVVGAFMAALNNLIAFFFLVLFFFPIKSLFWVGYLMVVSMALPVPLLMMTSGEYRRLRVDAQGESDNAESGGGEDGYGRLEDEEDEGIDEEEVEEGPARDVRT